MGKPTTLKKYAYLWVTLFLFTLSILGHWIFAWFSYVDEQKEHNQPIEINSYITKTFRDTFENWQSEFLQLIWQVAGLTYLWYVGSPQSKEGNDRTEAKIDAILNAVSKEKSKKIISVLEKKYPK